MFYQDELSQKPHLMILQAKSTKKLVICRTKLMDCKNELMNWNKKMPS
nr:MAG TPA: hypothetical protein [Caudoviricetes sp.]